MADIERTSQARPIVNEANLAIDDKTVSLKIGETVAQMTERVRLAWGENMPSDVKEELIRRNQEDRQNRHQRVLGSSNPALVSGQKDQWFENPNRKL
ncbi:MAG TPA: hypothetical protein VF185_03940 [Patescibacteria group bacterium]